MRLITIVLIVLLFCVSCGRKVPEDVVPQRQMGALLLDMHLADGQLASMVADSARVYRNTYYDAIFNRYGVDSSAFKRSLEFYATRPQLMKELYVDIEKQLEAYNTAAQQAMTDEYDMKRRADSLANARRADSLRNVARDSLDFKRKRYLLFLNGPDSLPYGRPVPITHLLLHERMLEAIGLGDGHITPVQHDTSRIQPVKPPVTGTPAQDTPPEPMLKPIKKIN